MGWPGAFVALSVAAQLWRDDLSGRRAGTRADDAQRSAFVHLMQGDGPHMGWVVIEKVTEQSSHLDRHGFGKFIDVDISVKRTSKPSTAAYFAVF